MGHSVVKSALRIDDLVQHPCCSTAAGYEFDVVAVGCPVVPEVFEGTDKVTSFCVKPWEFVEKQYFSLIVRGFIYMFLDETEGVCPVGGMLGDAKLVGYGIVEVGKLFASLYIVLACHSEVKLIFEELFDKECLAHAPSAIDGHKFRFR